MHPKKRTRWAAIAAALASLATMAALLRVAGASSPSPAPVVTTFSPCRLMDTRPTTQVGPRSAPLGVEETYTADVWGSHGNCTIPTGTLGVVANVTVVNGSAASFLTVFPAGEPRPTASNLNWVAGQQPTPNQVTAALSSTGQLSLYNLAGSVDVIVDIVGTLTDHNHDDQYVTPLYAVVRANGTLVRGSHVVAASNPTGSTYRVQFDRDVSGCAYSALVESAVIGFAVVAPPAIVPDPNSVVLATGDLTGFANRPFHLVVTC
jgi:hypothetical protein